MIRTYRLAWAISDASDVMELMRIELAEAAKATNRGPGYMAAVNMRLTAGGVRELHWHTANEWAIVLYGSARITAIDRDGKSFVADTKKNDARCALPVSDVPFGSIADLTARSRHVRFTPNNGRWTAIQVSIWLSVYEDKP
jgi:Cupin